MTYGMIFTILLLTSSFLVIINAVFVIKMKIRVTLLLRKMELFSDMEIFVSKYIHIKMEKHLMGFPCIAEYLDKSFETISEIITQGDLEYRHVSIGKYTSPSWIAELDKEIATANTKLKEVVVFNKNLIMSMYRYKYPLRYFFDLHKQENNIKFEIDGSNPEEGDSDNV